MEKPRLNVVTLGVTDFARAVRFYQDLGLSAASRRPATTSRSSTVAAW